MKRYVVCASKENDSTIMIADRETRTSFKINKKSLAFDFPFDFDQELCDDLFKLDDKLYKVFPVEFRSDEMTREMIKRYKREYYIYFPQKYHTREMQDYFFPRKSRHLKPNIDEYIITRDFGKYTIQYKLDKSRNYVVTSVEVHDNETDEKMIFSKKTLKDKSFEFTQELCDALCIIDDMFYKKIPLEFRSEKLTKKMIEKYNHHFYEYYPEKYIDKKMTYDYVSMKGSHLLFVPEEYLNQRLCNEYVLANPKSLAEVPDKYIQIKHIDYILEKGLHLGFVPLEYRTVPVCLRFIKARSRDIYFVPDSKLHKVCEALGYEGVNLPSDSIWMRPKEDSMNDLVKRKKD